MTMSQRERYIAMATAVVVGLLLLDRIVLTPLLDRLSTANLAIDQAQQELSRVAGWFDNSTRAQRTWRAIAGGTLLHDAPNAESQVLNQARGWAQASGLALSSLKPERTEKERDFQKITIRATGTGTMAQIARFLHAAQTTSIPVRVTDLQIAARRQGGATDDLSVNVGLATIFVPQETR